MFLAPGNTPRSSRATDRPARASVSAAAAPAGPAPTTTASKSGSGTAPRLLARLAGVPDAESARQLTQQRAGVGDEGEVGQAHHRAARVGVDSDHDVRGAEPVHVLHRPGDADGEIELRA